MIAPQDRDIPLVAQLFRHLAPGRLTVTSAGMEHFADAVVRDAGGMVEFRRSLAASFLFRFFLLSSYKLAADSDTFQASFPETYKSAVKVSVAAALYPLYESCANRANLSWSPRSDRVVGLRSKHHCAVFDTLV